MNRLREKTTATLLIAIFVVSTFAVVSAIEGPPVISLLVKGNAVAEMSYGDGVGGSDCVHLQTLSTPETGDEGRVKILMPDGFTLGDLETISWMEWLGAGYPPHVDIMLDLVEDGWYEPGVDDALVFEYAYNSHTGDVQPTYGALTGAWYQTFSDDGKGPSVLDDLAYGWLTSGPAGGPDIIGGTLDNWKTGGIEGGKGISATTPVLHLEFEVDNWMANTEAFIDDIEINGEVYDFDGEASTSLRSVIRDPVISISVSPTDIDFGVLIRGHTSELIAIYMTNTGEAKIGVEFELFDLGMNSLVPGDFYYDHLFIGNPSSTRPIHDYTTAIQTGETGYFTMYLDIPQSEDIGTYEGILVFWAEEYEIL